MFKSLHVINITPKVAILTTDGFLHIKECSSLCIEVFSVHKGMFCACMFMFESYNIFLTIT